MVLNSQSTNAKKVSGTSLYHTYRRKRVDVHFLETFSFVVPSVISARSALRRFDLPPAIESWHIKHVRTHT